ncbi:MAG: ABC transporter [Bacteroidetes bacterium]|nr:MAG: ABC transporter [Bacteroidota bacterium]
MKSLRTLNPLFWKYRKRLFIGIVFILFTNALAVFAPALVGEGINVLRESSQDYLAPVAEATSDSEITKIISSNDGIKLPHILATIAEYTGMGNLWNGEVKSINDVHKLVITIAIFQALLYLLTFLIKGVFLYFTRQTIIVNSRLMEFDLKEKVYAHYQNLDSSFYKSHDTGDLMNRISEDVSKVRMYLGPAVLYSLNLAALIIMVVGVMISIDVKLTLYALLPLPLMSVGIYFISSKINQLSDAVASTQSDLTSFAQQHISGIRVLQSYAREAKSADRFESESDEYKKHVLNLVKVESLFMPIIILLVGLSTVLTVYIGGVQVIEGNLELGHIFQFIFYVNLLTWPFASVGWVTSLVQKAEASMARILDFLETDTEIKSGTETITYPSLESSLVFRDVSFTYPDTGINVLKNINFELKKGMTVAITGRTGSGKSTIVQLAIRMIDPSSGSIEYRGKDLQSLDLGKYRERTGYVPQDVFLFSDTIKNNIGFGLDTNDNSEELFSKIKEAAHDADVGADIEGFENSYDSVLGERGVNLSGGQKQRISIARALVRHPEIIILDDCLSAVDTITEKNIKNRLKKGESDRSALIVSHRISTIKDADLILVLEEGEITERGTHEELLNRKGVYFNMFEKQKQDPDETNY